MKDPKDMFTNMINMNFLSINKSVKMLCLLSYFFKPFLYCNRKDNLMFLIVFKTTQNIVLSKFIVFFDNLLIIIKKQFMDFTL